MSFDLETAASPQGLRRVAIDPVSRVEQDRHLAVALDTRDRVDGDTAQALRGGSGFQ